MGLRSFLLAACVAGASMAMSLDAHAMGAIVSDPPGAAQATSVRVALAFAGSRTSRWVSLHVHVQDGPAAGLAWIVPVKPIMLMVPARESTLNPKNCGAPLLFSGPLS